MDAYTRLQSSVQSPPQKGAGGPGVHSPANVPEHSATPRPPPVSDSNGIDARVLKNIRDRRNEKLRDLSRTFGNIPGVPIFTQWDRRIDCSNSAVHRSIMAGICGNSIDGVYSVALSGIYRDNEDGGDVIIYTGAGGRRRWTDTNPPKRIRLGPQTEDQSWDKSPNNGLIVSFHTGNPVRVIRSWQCRSQYAPLQGYRYDGLYKVAAYWTAKGCNGKIICRCRLERLPDQPPVPVRPITFPVLRGRPKERLVSHPTSSPLTYTNQTDTSSMQSAGGTAREFGGLSSAPQQQAPSETACAVDSDTKVPRLPSHQRQVSPKHSVLPIYKWDPKKNELVRLPAPHPIPEDLDVGEGDEEEHRGEDDITLVSSEDGGVNECMEWD